VVGSAALGERNGTRNDGAIARADAAHQVGEVARRGLGRWHAEQRFSMCFSDLTASQPAIPRPQTDGYYSARCGLGGDAWGDKQRPLGQNPCWPWQLIRPRARYVGPALDNVSARQDFELAGSIAELAKRALASDFRTIDPRSTRIVLVEAGPRVRANVFRRHQPSLRPMKRPPSAI
jgi:hypothetical protein